MFQIMDLTLREPPKDAVQPTPEFENEDEEQHDEETEVVIEKEAESQKEAEIKLKEKVTLKELADQNKAAKADKDVVSETKETKIDQTEADSAEKEVVEIKDDASRKVISGEVEIVTSEVKDSISETADKVQPTDLKEEEANLPISEPVTLSNEETEPMAEVGTEEVKEDQKGEITAEDVKADLKEKAAMMLQEDTTDSEVIEKFRNVSTQPRSGLRLS